MLLVALVFTGVFVVAALLIAASGVGASEREKQTLARLDAVLAADITKSDDELGDFRRKELLSSIPLLNRILLEFEIAPKLRLLLYQANLKWTPGVLLLLSITLWVIISYLIYLRIDSVVAAPILGLIPGAAPIAYVFHKRSQRFQKFAAGLPPALDLMVNGLRGGHSLVAAIGLVGREAGDPIGREFQVCYEEQNYGLEFRTAMENLSTRIPIQDVKIITTAILIQKETGGNLAEVLDKCSYVIRERFRLKREIRTKTAQGRLTGWILSFLPVALGALLFIVNPEGISLLWKHPLGQKMLYTGAIMTLCGALIIRKIVRIRV
jgi:tight adherence protein B